MALLLWLAGAGLSTATIALGRTQPLNPTLAGFVEGCDRLPQPCWYGLVPGDTTPDAARARMERLGYTFRKEHSSSRVLTFMSAHRMPGCVNIYLSGSQQPINRLGLYCFDLTVGEVIAVLGKPGHLAFDLPFGHFLAYPHLTLDIPETALSPRNGVHSIYVDAAERLYLSRMTASPWAGLAPRWRYCQLNPRFLDCARRS
jgi:hypothetical protein